MKHERRQLETPDGTSLRFEQWEPDGAVRCVVVVSHGAGEHVGRYADVARDLEELGALVFGPDHRGQGESGGKPGHIDDFDVYGADLDHLMQSVASERPADQQPDQIPWFVFAHSMGALITLNALIGDLLSLPLRGVVLSGPLLRVAVPTPAIKVWLGKMAGVMAPGLTLPSGIPPESVCRDEEEVARYAADERGVGVVSARWFQKMNQAVARVEAGIAGVELPLLWYVGTGDKICDHTASLELFEKLADPQANDQCLRTFDGYYHELHNEPPELRAPVIEMVQQWIRARID